MEYQVSELYLAKVNMLRILDIAILCYLDATEEPFRSKYQRRLDLILKLTNKVDAVLVHTQTNLLFHNALKKFY